MSSGGDDRGMMAEINVTPFVDVMLVLLIIFMITAPMMTTGLKVDLPRVEAPAMSAEEQTTLSITAEGEYAINESRFSFDSLEPKLAAIVAAHPDRPVFLKADGKVPYQKVAELMALCTKVGVPRMGMVTEPGVSE